MQSLEGTKAWILANRDICVEALRIYLGIGLFLKGLNFVFTNQPLENMMERSIDLPFFEFLSIHFIGLAHIFGGLMLAAGLLTRVAAFIQVPILLGAVLFVAWPQGVFSMTETLEFTVLVLFLLIFFTIYGSGRISVDTVLARKSVERSED